MLGVRLGSGAHGVVWAAKDTQDTELGAEVALKILDDVTGELSHRLRREGKLAFTATHPNLLKVYGICEHEGAPVLVMERLWGRSLRQHLQIVLPFEGAPLASVVAEVLAGVSALHGMGIVHRDLKPENVFLASTSGSSRPVAKVLDFGLAKWLAAASGTLRTRTGHRVGTPAYMAPEQIFGELDTDVRVDIWSIGAIVFECLTGDVPFGTREPGHVLRAASLGTPTPLLSRRGDVPDPLAALIDQMLSVDRARRPPLSLLLTELPRLLRVMGL